MVGFRSITVRDILVNYALAEETIYLVEFVVREILLHLVLNL